MKFDSSSIADEALTILRNWLQVEIDRGTIRRCACGSCKMASHQDMLAYVNGAETEDMNTVHDVHALVIVAERKAKRKAKG